MRILISAVLVLGSIGPLAAQGYPSRPITVINTAPAGNFVDLTTRFIGERVREKTGQPWVIENKPGALGSVAAQAAAIAKPDGYTGFICPSGPLSANQYLLKSLNYSQKDFQLVARLFKIDFALVVNPEKTPVKNIAELTAFLKGKAGKISYGYFSASMRSLAEQYLHLKGLTASPAAYRSTVQMMNELEAGEYDFSFASVDLLVKPSPKLRILAIASETRSTLFPDLPTQAEAGLAKALPLSGWFAFCFPAGTPDIAAKTLAPILLEIVGRDEFKAFLKNLASEPYPGDAAELAKSLDQSNKDWKFFVTIGKMEPQ